MCFYQRPRRDFGIGARSYPNTATMSSELQKAARSMGASDSHYERQVGKELNATLVSLDKVQAEGLVVAAKSFFDNHRDRIVALSSQYSVAGVYLWREYVVGGSLWIQLAESHR
jgi:hypothetical protein